MAPGEVDDEGVGGGGAFLDVEEDAGAGEDGRRLVWRRAAVSGERPRAGMPGSSRRPQEPATGAAGSGPSMRKAAAPAAMAAAYLRRPVEVPGGEHVFVADEGDAAA